VAECRLLLQRYSVWVDPIVLRRWREEAQIQRGKGGVHTSGLTAQIQRGRGGAPRGGERGEGQPSD